MIRARSQDDHRAATGVLGVLCELTADPLGSGCGHAGDLLLPSRGVGAGVVVAVRPLAGQTVTAHAVLRQHQVEDRRDKSRPVLGLDPAGGHAAGVRGAPLVVLLPGVEARQKHFDVLGAGCAIERQRGINPFEV